MILEMRVRALLHAVNAWLGLLGESCCVGRSQVALARTLARGRPYAE
jgi:hypothetical protein